MVIADLATSELVPATAANAHRARGDAAILAIPVAVGGRLKGVMELTGSQSRRSFTVANIAFAEFVAHQAAELVASGGDTSHHMDRRSPPDDATAVSAAAAPVVARPPDRRQLLRSLSEHLRSELDALACDILRFDPADRRLTLVAAASTGHVAPPEGTSYAIDDDHDVAAAFAGPSTMTSVALDAERVNPVGWLRRTHDHATCVIRVPLRLGSAPVGLLELQPLLPRRSRTTRTTLSLCSVWRPSTR
jgi:GAF domain-containing protein